MGLNKTILAGILSGMGSVPPSTVLKSLSDFPSALSGYYTEEIVSGNNKVKFADPGCVLAFLIKGSSASLYCGSGSGAIAYPYRVLVDSFDTYPAFVTPPLPVGTDPNRKLVLFSGLADSWHTVLIWRNASTSGQWLYSNKPMIEVFGSGAQVVPLGAIYNPVDPAFPGVYTSPRVTVSAIPTVAPTSSSGWGAMNTGSLHFRARFDEIYILSRQQCVMASVNGSGLTRYDLASTDAGAAVPTYSPLWRKLPIAGSGSSMAEVIISGGGGAGTSAYGFGANNEILGVCLTGEFAQMAAPKAKRHLTLIGASQAQGNGGTGAGNSAEVDCHMIQNRIDVYALNVAQAGGTIAACNTAMPATLAKIPYKDIAMLSIGINSNDDAQFITDYKALIQTLLMSGYNKVICRTLVTTGSNTSRNSKIAQAVTETADARVVLADTSTWTATTSGGVGVIKMPDGAHPSADGYSTMADLTVRDHFGLFV